MRLADLVSLILYNLNRRKGRVAMTAIGVVIGTASVVLLVSLAVGLQQNAADQLGGIGNLTMITVYPNYGEGVFVRSYGGGGGGGGSEAGQTKLLTRSALSEMNALSNVVQVIPRDYLQASYFIRFGKMETWANVTGMEIEDIAIFEYPLLEGESQLARGTAIIGGWAAKNFQDYSLRPGQEPPPQPDLLGQQIRLVLVKYSEDGQEIKKTINLRIVGVLAEARGEQDSSLYVRMEDLVAWNEWAQGARIDRNRRGYDNFVIKVDDVANVTAVADQINALGYMASTPQQYVQSINSFFTIMQLTFGGVGAIALLVAAIGIANTMTMAILERTREIGLMKAVGATNRDVLSIFLGEAAGIGFLGGLGGVLIGWGGGRVINLVALTYLAGRAAETGGAPPSVAVSTPLWLPLFAIIFATLIGLFSGLFPALRAATLVPVTALKYE
ncbi:MAG: ABC transporter permease [Anaerolineae bacterium]|nr:ABC transporter permease [Anaerolineae bacterium]